MIKLRGYFCEIDETNRLVFTYCEDAAAQWPSTAVEKPPTAPQLIPPARAKLIRAGYRRAVRDPRRFAVHLPRWAKAHHLDEFRGDVGLECDLEIVVKPYRGQYESGMFLMLGSLTAIRADDIVIKNKE